jgi:hypothetical protein
MHGIALTGRARVKVHHSPSFSRLYGAQMSDAPSALGRSRASYGLHKKGLLLTLLVDGLAGDEALVDVFECSTPN